MPGRLGARLLPRPRQLVDLGGELLVPADGLVVLAVPSPARLLGSADRLVAASGRAWEIVSSPSVPAADVRVLVMIDADEVPQPEGYRLVGTGSLIEIVAHDVDGARYGLDTAAQVISLGGSPQAALRIDDHPALARRGFMLDISRDKVPTMETLAVLVEILADLRYNELQLYTEHTFAYQHHRVVWADASPMTAHEILVLDQLCAERGIELVPNQNSFGHLERWFAHGPYRDLAEMPDGFTTAFGTRFPHGFSLNASDPAIFTFLAGLYDELLPNFSSGEFNVGLDETWDLGQGRSADLVAEVGKGRVYLDTLTRIADLVDARGRTMQFWGDVVNEHPELVPELPDNVVALEWGYEADHPFEERAGRFADAGVRFRLCPGTSGWNTIGGRLDNALANTERAVDAAIGGGAEGVLLTDWGDNGHWQPLPISLPAIVRTGVNAWGPEANRDVELDAAIATVTGDASGLLGRYLDQLGMVYRRSGLSSPNSTPLFWLLRLRKDEVASLLEWTEPEPTTENTHGRAA